MKKIAINLDSYIILAPKTGCISLEIREMSATELVTIAANRRQETGKGYARKLRARNLIPANLMEKSKATAIELDPKWLSKAWKSGKKFNLELDGTTKPVIIKELQVSAVRREVQHVDLMYA